MGSKFPPTSPAGASYICRARMGRDLLFVIPTGIPLPYLGTYAELKREVGKWRRMVKTEVIRVLGGWVENGGDDTFQVAA
jgi:hypothetical protein